MKHLHIGVASLLVVAFCGLAVLLNAQTIAPGILVAANPCPPAAAVCPLPSFDAPQLFSLAGPHVGGDIFAAIENDFNGDGIPDFAVLAFGIADLDQQTSVSVFIGNGDGTFKAPVNYPIGGGPVVTLMLAGRFRGPNAPVDLLVADSSGAVGGNHPVLVLLGNGDGTFQAAKAVGALSGVGSEAIAVGDFNEDGKLDIALKVNFDSDPTAAESQGLAVLLGNGDGTFGQPLFSPGAVAIAFSRMLVADFNKDGHLDLLGGGGGYLYLGSGDGTFKPAIETGVRVGDDTFAIGDFNGDGILDLAVNTTSAFDSCSGLPLAKAELDVYLGTDTGAFMLKETHDLKELNQTGSGFVAVGDLNGDGVSDVIATTGPEGTIAVLFGNGDGTFQSPATYPMAETQGTIVQSSLFVTDVDNDGTPDVVTVANLASLSSGAGSGVGLNYLTVMFNQGRGVFARPQRFPVGAFSQCVNVRNAVGIAIDDLNGDGKPDLVVSEWGCPLEPPLTNPLAIAAFAECNQNALAVLLGNGDGTFGLEQEYLVGAHPFDVVIADLTGDGKKDLVTANASSNTLSLLKGNGDGTFQTPIAIAVGNNPESVVLADFDGDGKPDIAVNNLSDNTISVLLNRSTPGNIAFATAVNFDVGIGPVSLVVGDFNHDGKADLVTANTGDPSTLTGPSTLSVLLGNGDGTFSSATHQGLFPDFGVAGLVTGDFSGSGWLDLAVIHFGRSQVLVLANNGDGTFISQATYQVGEGPEDIKTADVNGDGKLDLIVSDLNDNTVAILLGKGDGTFAPAADNTTDQPHRFGWPAFAFPSFLGIADLTGKGKADIVTTNLLDATVTVLVNTRPDPARLTKVISRKIHGSAGTFDIDLTSGSAIECRSGGTNGDYRLVFSFANPLTSVAGAAVTSGSGMVSSGAIDPADAYNYIVNLTGVTTAQIITVSLNDVADTAGDFSSAVPIPMGVLVGDVNGSRRVDAADVSSVRQQTLQPVNASSFRNDINASGRIDAADVSIARQQTLMSLP